VRLLEVIGVALARVEVALSNIRHAYMLPRPSELFWGRPGPAEGRQKSVWIAEPASRSIAGRAAGRAPKYRLRMPSRRSQAWHRLLSHVVGNGQHLASDRLQIDLGAQQTG
jgi:hypothetical protein